MASFVPWVTVMKKLSKRVLRSYYQDNQGLWLALGFEGKPIVGSARAFKLKHNFFDELKKERYIFG